jgi:hypothetical protein
VGQCDLLAAVSSRVLEGVATDPLGAEARDDHDGLRCRTRVTMHADVVLDTDIQALGVLADEHQIDILVPTSRHERPHRPHVRIEVERRSELNVDGAETRSRGGREWPLQDDAVPLSGIQRALGKRVPQLLESDQPRELLVVLEVRGGRIEYGQRRLGDFRPDTVARNYGDGLRHSLSVRRRGLGLYPSAQQSDTVH